MKTNPMRTKSSLAMMYEGVYLGMLDLRDLMQLFIVIECRGVCVKSTIHCTRVRLNVSSYINRYRYNNGSKAKPTKTTTRYAQTYISPRSDTRCVASR